MDSKLPGAYLELELSIVVKINAIVVSNASIFEALLQ